MDDSAPVNVGEPQAEPVDATLRRNLAGALADVERLTKENAATERALTAAKADAEVLERENVRVLEALDIAIRDRNLAQQGRADAETQLANASLHPVKVQATGYTGA